MAPVAVGEGVKKVSRGDRVYTARTLTGAYAECALALEEQVHPLPANIDFKQGAGIWVPYGTAYHALHHSAKAHASETALVHGASGGVGIAALQIARSRGLKVLGTAGTPKGLEIAKREGAHQVFDHRKSGYQEEILQSTDNRGVDIILEMLAPPDLNPIEMPYSKFKTFLRKVAARTIPSLNRAIRSFIPQLSPQECANYFRHAGYVSI